MTFFKKKLFSLNKTKFRKKKREKYKKFLGDFNFKLKNQYFFNLKNVLKLRKYHKKILKIKRNRKLRDYFVRKKIIWVFFKKNFIVTKKPKNCRMGNGKGISIKLICVLRKNLKFIEYRYYNLNSVKYILGKFIKRKNLKLVLSFDYKKTKVYFFKKNNFLNFLKAKNKKFFKNFLYYKFKTNW